MPLVAALSASSPVLDLAKAIQLSVAPVFLLAAVAGLLGVISGRLTRVLDRAAQFKGTAIDAADLNLLRRRMVLLTRASASVTVTGILVASVVAVTFVGVIAVIDLTPIVVALFVLAMVMLILGLLQLLIDTRLASWLIQRRF
jgi:hypothetical protein